MRSLTVLMLLLLPLLADAAEPFALPGSGEFHVYKQSRRREYERLKAMDEEDAKVCRPLVQLLFERPSRYPMEPAR